MKFKTITKIILAFSFLLTTSCSMDSKGTYIYSPADSIIYTLHTKEVKYHQDLKKVFLYFELQIENKSNKKVFLDVGEIQANLNGELSSATYFDSLASVLPEKELLESGLKEYKLYFVFPASLKGEKINNFKVTNFGLTIK